MLDPRNVKSLHFGVKTWCACASLLLLNFLRHQATKHFYKLTISHTGCIMKSQLSGCSYVLIGGSSLFIFSYPPSQASREAETDLRISSATNLWSRSPHDEFHRAAKKSRVCLQTCLQHSGWSPVILLSNNHNHTKLFTVHAFLRSPSLIILEAILWDRSQMLSAKANTRVDYELGGAYTPASVTVASRCFSYYCRSRKLGAFQNKNDMARLLHDNIKPLNIILQM